jgi:hypothetical protein
MSARRNPIVRILILVGLAAALSLAACGGDDGDAVPAANAERVPASNAELIERADAICEREDNEIAADAVSRFGEDRLGAAPRAEERAFVTEAVIPGIQAQIDELSELEVPDGDSGRFDEFVAALRQGLKRAEGDPLELTIYGDTSRQDPVFKDALRLAEQIGFDDCTEGEPDIPG